MKNEPPSSRDGAARGKRSLLMLLIGSACAIAYFTTRNPSAFYGMMLSWILYLCYKP